MRKCRFCHEDIDDAARVCVHCGRELFAAPIAAVVPAPPVTRSFGERTSAAVAVFAREMQTPEPVIPAAAPPAVARVCVVDVSMPFSSMVGFMLKWALASIPAAILFGIIVGGLWLLLMTVIAVVR
jgi:hypothetical protein